MNQGPSTHISVCLSPLHHANVIIGGYLSDYVTTCRSHGPRCPKSRILSSNAATSLLCFLPPHPSRSRCIPHTAHPRHHCQPLPPSSTNPDKFPHLSHHLRLLTITPFRTTRATSAAITSLIATENGPQVRAPPPSSTMTATACRFDNDDDAPR